MDAGRTAMPGRSWAMALTLLLHAGVLTILLAQTRLSPAPVIAERRSTLVFVRLPSAVTQVETSAAANRRPVPPPKAARRRPPAAAHRPKSAPAPAVPSQPQVPSPPGSTDAAPTPADVDPDVPPPIEYLRRISRIIHFEQKYPWSARQYDQQGDVLVRMHLARDGRVISVRLIHSSGYAALDAEARNVILRVARFPPFPSDYLPQIGEFDIDQPITFRHYLN